MVNFMAIIFFVNSSFAQYAPTNDNMPFLGNPNAKVTIIEYGSLTCSHCKEFQDKVFSTLRDKYINTGKIKFIYKPFLTEPIELSMGMQIIADCAGGDKRYKIIEDFFANQTKVFEAATSSQGPLNFMLTIGERNGLSKGQAKMCLGTEVMQTNIENIMNFAHKTYGISGTPSIIINGKLIVPPNNEEYSAAFVSNAIDSELRLVTNTPTKTNPKLVKKAKKN